MRFKLPELGFDEYVGLVVSFADLNKWVIGIQEGGYEIKERDGGAISRPSKVVEVHEPNGQLLVAVTFVSARKLTNDRYMPSAHGWDTAIFVEFMSRTQVDLIINKGG